MIWPWQKSEKRETQPFTDAFAQALYSIAGGNVLADPSTLGILEVASGFWSRAFATAKPSPENAVTRSLTPAILAQIGRQLCRRGEAVFQIKVNGGNVSLLPVASWDISGGPEESSWMYKLSIFGASVHRTEYVPSEGVLHFRYSVDPGNPWLGLSPLAYAKDTGRLAANLEKRLGEEVGGIVAKVIPLPQNSPPEELENEENPSPLDMLKSDIMKSKGETFFVETTSGGYGEGQVAAPQQDWQQKRIGPDPPQSLEKIRTAVQETVLACCGVPLELAELGQGTAGREGWRRFLHGTVDPLGVLVAEELTRKFEFPVSLDFSALQASDISGRARAFQSMVGGGMDVSKAAALSGLLINE